MAPSGSPTAERISRSKRGRRLSEAMRCETAFRLIVSECLEEVAINHAATSAGDPIALHHMRVALTRLRATIAFYSTMVADAEWTRLKFELKWLNGYLGPTRDLDVAIEDSRGTSGARAYQAARAASHQQLQRALESDRYRQWFEAMWDWVGSGPWSVRQDRHSALRRASPVSVFHARRLARWHEKLARRSRGLQGMGKNKRHRLRLASKRLRYAIEFSDGALPAEDFSQWRNVVKHLRKGQQILGELNDDEIRRLLATSLGESPKRAATPHQEQAKLHDRKRKGRLLRRAAAIYRKIAG
jgi:CHAD domain-containing protein